MGLGRAVGDGAPTVPPAPPPIPDGWPPATPAGSVLRLQALDQERHYLLGRVGPLVPVPDHALDPQLVHPVALGSRPHRPRPAHCVPHASFLGTGPLAYSWPTRTMIR